jgi:hypothetical protein
LWLNFVNYTGVSEDYQDVNTPIEPGILTISWNHTDHHEVSFGIHGLFVRFGVISFFFAALFLAFTRTRHECQFATKPRIFPKKGTCPERGAAQGIEAEIPQGQAGKLAASRPAPRNWSG